MNTAQIYYLISRVYGFLLLAVVLCGTSLGGNTPISVVCVGDSIVAPYSMDEYRQGWGETLKEKLVDTTVYNRGSGGKSSKSFYEPAIYNLWAPALAIVDSTSAKYVFIEFGHNDNPGKPYETDPSVGGDFREYIRHYIDDSRAHGAIPILITPPPRWYWSGGVITNNGNLPYAQAMIAVAAEKNCTVVDLNTKVLNLFNLLGQAGSDYLMGTIVSGSSYTKDSTHFSHTAALILAKMIVEDLPATETAIIPYLDPNGGPGAIGRAGGPVPANRAMGKALNTTLSWTAGANARGHVVYFGTVNPPPFKVNLTARSPVTYNPGTLASNTTYYWRIDAINQRGTAQGLLWKFSTAASGCSTVYEGDLNADCKVDLSDFAIMANQWLGSPQTPTADIVPIGVGDGVVDNKDLEQLAFDWLSGTSI